MNFGFSGKGKEVKMEITMQFVNNYGRDIQPNFRIRIRKIPKEKVLGKFSRKIISRLSPRKFFCSFLTNVESLANYSYYTVIIHKITCTMHEASFLNYSLFCKQNSYLPLIKN